MDNRRRLVKFLAVADNQLDIIDKRLWCLVETFIQLLSHGLEIYGLGYDSGIGGIGDDIDWLEEMLRMFVSSQMVEKFSERRVVGSGADFFAQFVHISCPSGVAD